MFVQSIANFCQVTTSKPICSTRNQRQNLRWTGWLCRGLSVLSMALMIFFAGHANAQLDQGAIIGVVQDGTGAVIPNAEVTLTNLDNGLVLKTKSNGDGNYFFAPIKIGNYTVSASAPNFQTTVESWCT
jgi:hypothetical protein